jgi:FAD/FMN-containing dehydrogenase
MPSRRTVLKSAAAAALLPAACSPLTRAALPGVLVNDVHSQLNPTRVRRIAKPSSVDALRALVRDERQLSICGGRHSMGGQQFGTDTVLVDTAGLDRVLAFDSERGLLEVEAGIQWPALIDAYLKRQAGAASPWGIAQKQTGADRLSLGGALSANAHGRGLTLAPLVQDVESLRVVNARGELVRCSRDEEPELFRHVIGGYGLFGMVASVELRLTPRVKLERVVEVIDRDGLIDAFDRRIAEGHLYGDFQFAVDPQSPDFMRRGVFACYRPTDPDAPLSAPRELADSDWVELLGAAHSDPTMAFERYAEYYLSTHGQTYWSDTQQLGFYADDYHALLDGDGPRGSEVISELYVPRAALATFLGDMGDVLQAHQTRVVYGTVRLIERDDVTALPWAREPWACTVVNLHADHTPAGLQRAADAFRGLIDAAQAHGGSFFLTYHRHATREQVLRSYPQMPDVLAAKLRHDPDERFTSDWYTHMRALMA